MSKLEIYQAQNGSIEFKSDIENETIWASLEQIAKLFNRDKSGISRHIKNIFNNNELEKLAVVAIIATTASDGKTYDDNEVYHIGASLKDLGKKVFAFSKIDKEMLRWSNDE